jgi:hypothetical protein
MRRLIAGAIIRVELFNDQSFLICVRLKMLQKLIIAIFLCDPLTRDVLPELTLLVLIVSEFLLPVEVGLTMINIMEKVSV